MLEHKGLYWSKIKGTEDAKTIEPDEDYIIPFGKGRVVQEASEENISNGKSLTVITYGMGVYWAKSAAKKFEGQIEIIDLNKVEPQRLLSGNEVTVVGISYTSLLCEKACIEVFNEKGISSDLFDMRVLNPLKIQKIIDSVKRTGRLIVVDGDWQNCGMASEIITSVIEKIDPAIMKNSPKRITLPNAPAPTSKILEQNYYIKEQDIINALIEITA
jgi:pyruvate/2-oxoglutarate/acetoin dehydrogenase E1 component